jgi:N-acetylglucosaminyldiphosphoundecaprenol N-acetyl-beta-D-mannosaminyltransferase
MNISIKVRERADILGFQVDRMTLQECVHRLTAAISERTPIHIVLVNAAKIVRARQDHELAHIIRTADLVGADGVSIVWTSRILSCPLPGRVNGTDLMNRLIKVSAEKGFRIYFLGAKADLIEKAVAHVKKQYPTLQIAGYRNGYFSSSSQEEQAVQEIAAARADILLVGMSTPMKEKWVRKHQYNLATPVIHGVGGSFDILAGYVKRAPLWMQRWGLEWLYRVLQEPRRLWRRYLVTNLVFIMLVIKQLLYTKFKKRS